MKLPKTVNEVEEHIKKFADIEANDIALLEKQNAALEQEANEAARRTALQVKQELSAGQHKAQMKKAALAKWMQIGGSPSDFEVAWALIYQHILQAEAIQKMIGRPSKHFSL